MAGRDAAPAGVVRSCTLGRTPEQPRRLLPGRLGSGHRETRKRKDVAWRADRRGFLLPAAPARRAHPLAWGREKRRALPRPMQSRDPPRVGYALDLLTRENVNAAATAE